MSSESPEEGDQVGQVFLDFKMCVENEGYVVELAGRRISNRFSRSFWIR